MELLKNSWVRFKTALNHPVAAPQELFSSILALLAALVFYFRGAAVSDATDQVKDPSTCFTIKYPENVIVVDPESTNLDVHLYLAQDDEAISHQSVSPGRLLRYENLCMAVEAACYIASKGYARKVSIVHLPDKNGDMYQDPFEKIPLERAPRDFCLEIVGAHVMDFPTAGDPADPYFTLTHILQKGLPRPLTLLYSKTCLAVGGLELTLRNLALATDSKADEVGDFALVVAYQARVHCINVGFVAAHKTGIRVHGAGKSCFCVRERG